jgi:hypothetical protein
MWTNEQHSFRRNVEFKKKTTKTCPIYADLHKTDLFFMQIGARR